MATGSFTLIIAKFWSLFEQKVLWNLYCEMHFSARAVRAVSKFPSWSAAWTRQLGSLQHSPELTCHQNQNNKLFLKCDKSLTYFATGAGHVSACTAGKDVHAWILQMKLRTEEVLNDTLHSCVYCRYYYETTDLYWTKVLPSNRVVKNNKAPKRAQTSDVPHFVRHELSWLPTKFSGLAEVCAHNNNRLLCECSP